MKLIETINADHVDRIVPVISLLRNDGVRIAKLAEGAGFPVSKDDYGAKGHIFPRSRPEGFDELSDLRLLRARQLADVLENLKQRNRHKSQIHARGNIPLYARLHGARIAFAAWV